MKAIESNNKWYFRNTDTLSLDDDIATSIMLPVDQITGITPGNVTSRVLIHFEQPTAIGAAETYTGNGFVQLNTTAGYSKDVLEFLAEAANSSTQHTGFQTIVDEYTKEFAHKYITGVNAISNK